MKKLILLIIFNFLNIQNLYLQSDPIQQAEILIRNKTNHQLFIIVYPISSLFSGLATPPTDFMQKYSLIRSDPDDDVYWPTYGPQNVQLIVGGTKLVYSEKYTVIDFDDGNYYNLPDSADKVLGGVSYGLWRFEFYYSPDGPPHEDLIADCFIDFRDFNRQTELDFNVDIYLEIDRKAGSNYDSLYFNFVSGNSLNISDTLILNKTIKSWHKVGVTNSFGTNPIIPGSPNKGIYKSYPNFLTYPVYASEYGAVKHENAGNIDMNLEIDHNITVMLQVEMEFLNSYICKLKERKFHHVREKTLHRRAESCHS